jgi:hypothetical protein
MSSPYWWLLANLQRYSDSYIFFMTGGLGTNPHLPGTTGKLGNCTAPSNRESHECVQTRVLHGSRDASIDNAGPAILQGLGNQQDCSGGLFNVVEDHDIVTIEGADETGSHDGGASGWELAESGTERPSSGTPLGMDNGSHPGENGSGQIASLDIEQPEAKLPTDGNANSSSRKKKSAGS